VELRTLRYFVVVAKERNITRAAETLCMSQPPLSLQMQNLEEELGVTLFLRGKRKLTLTAEGEALLHRARQILDLTEKAEEELRAMSRGVSGTINLAMVEGRAPYLAARWIAGFREEYPQVRYSLWNGSGDDVLERLHKGLADLAVVAAPYDVEHLEGFPVGTEPWVAIIPRKHPLAALPGREVPLAKLVGCPLIVPSRKSRIQSLRQWFGEIGAEPDILCEMSNYVDAVALTEQEVGISIFPQTTYAPNDLVVSKVITQPARKAEYALVWSKEQSPSELAEEFIHYVQDFLQSDLIHSPRFRVRGEEHILPEETQRL
jgi:DNA-binding transcriptional LysR family regulator